MSQPKQTSPRSWTTRELAWGCIGSLVVGAVLIYGTGFHWIGEWQTGEQVGKKLAVASCVQDFLLQPDRAAMYSDLRSQTSAYKRRQVIQGAKLASGREVAELCDQRIQAFDPSYFEVPSEVVEPTEATNPA